ncbi:hypothetical protein ACFWD7_01420 [Streptomyces mirabilis]|uniref:hypothetical protein n=1 Tax=Streptomyces mirabilis TaxID=68239 RepID=UPI0021BFA382|nr:hypothetical protein [Streptomyces mirabilis]MCT9109139.1 hypothetical protein [Streptomyces mirabilis]
MAKPAGTTLVPQLWISSARPVGAGRTDRNEQSREDRTDHGAGARADDESSEGRPGHGRCDHVRSTKECRERPRRSDTSADRGRKGSETHRSDDAGDPAGMRCHRPSASRTADDPAIARPRDPVMSVRSINADSRELAKTLLAAVGAAAFQ